MIRLQKKRKGPAGDLLYRWGSPRTHGGPDEATTLFWQHDAHWTGNPGQTQIFNNGGLRAADGTYDPDQILLGHFDGAYSDILRLDLPVNSAGVWDGAREPQYFLVI